MQYLSADEKTEGLRIENLITSWNSTAAETMPSALAEMTDSVEFGLKDTDPNSRVIKSGRVRVRYQE